MVHVTLHSITGVLGSVESVPTTSLGDVVELFKQQNMISIPGVIAYNATVVRKPDLKQPIANFATADKLDLWFMPSLIHASFD